MLRYVDAIEVVRLSALIPFGLHGFCSFGSLLSAAGFTLSLTFDLTRVKSRLACLPAQSDTNVTDLNFLGSLETVDNYATFKLNRQLQVCSTPTSLMVQRVRAFVRRPAARFLSTC